MSDSKKRLEGKVTVVTGGASGIGEATARLFASHGARAVVIADIQDALGEQVAASIGAEVCTFARCDVTDEDQVEALVRSTILDLELSQFDRLMALNVRGVAACVKHAARAMVEGRVRGSILCTGSVSGSCGGVRRTDYHVSKHAVVGLVRSASVQLGAHGIRVNCVSPYALATRLTSASLGGMSAEEVERYYEPAMVLKGGGMLKAGDVAEAVLFLASDESAFITGHDLVVDGGFLLRR
ncbi:hypothetical protein EUGRSUZ_K02446 [Eucalyptus grandis]|uniref:Uncharacterized protein n=2 Tax=Eucalyptus grandis TaxID=71139 RepID=A0ACC3IWE5_EUCGR|nr:hypothetical protein EUGRSUZ_K02446 [Eucalyptus grandis]